MKLALIIYKYRTPIIIGVLAIVVILLIRRLLPGQQVKSEDARVIRNLERQAPGIDAGRLVRDASTIYNAFGLESSWWDPRSWTEDEDTVIAVLVKYDRQSFTLLENAYYDKFSRYLMADIRAYFRESQLEQIAHVL